MVKFSSGFQSNARRLPRGVSTTFKINADSDSALRSELGAPHRTGDTLYPIHKTLWISRN